MELILVRHGETDANSKEINNGQGHSELTALGLLQVKKLGERLKKERFDVIFVSDLKRTIDTAKEIIKFHPKTKVVYDSRIRERNIGELEGISYGKIKKIVEKAGVSKLVYKPVGGESIREMEKRVLSLLKEVMNRNMNKKILWVVHGGTIITVILHLFKKSDETFKKY